MACQFEVLLNAGQYAEGANRAVAALDLIDRLEDQLSVFRAQSEVSRLNRAAGQGEVEVEPRLFELLQLAAEIHRRSGGAYDITSGPLSKVWGFYRRAGQLPDEQALAAARSCVGSDRMTLDPQRRTVRFQTPGMEINLGSIGKGYSLDRAAELLEAGGVADFMLHGGQSSLLARGSRRMAAGGGWWVGVRHPLRPGARLGEVRLKNRALGTSGTGTQFFFHAGHRYGHILDPRTGWPAEGTLSTTVLARTAAEADALSTVFFVLGRDAALEYCRRDGEAHGAAHGGLAAIIVSPPARGGGTVDVATFGLADDDWRRLDG